MPLVVLDIIKRRPETPPDVEDKLIKSLPTLMMSKSIHWVQKAYRANPTKETISLILRSQEQLAVQHEIDQHIQRSLFETIKTEQQRQCRKRLNLISKENNGAQIFTLSQVHAALEYAATKEARATVEKAEKVAKKVQLKRYRLQKTSKRRRRKLRRKLYNVK